MRPYDEWALAERTRLRLRYVASALRAGELRLAGGSPTDAAAAAERAIAADPTSEPAYRLLARVHLARSDGSGARQVVERCRRALAGLGLEPDAATLAVLD
jgi:LuxR family maltose regulon positive regulatory protein